MPIHSRLARDRDIVVERDLQNDAANAQIGSPQSGPEVKRTKSPLFLFAGVWERIVGVGETLVCEKCSELPSNTYTGAGRTNFGLH